MADEQKDTEQPVTGTDIQIQALQKQMDAMRADYDSILKQYQDANRQLAGMLVTPEQAVPAEPVQKPSFDTEACAARFWKCIRKEMDR